MNRRRFLATGAFTLVATTTASGTVAPAHAALPPATPAGDDVAFLAFAAVAEGVLTQFYDAARAVRGAWSAADKGLLRDAHDHHRASVDRVNAALGPENAVSPGDFRHVVRVGSRAGTVRVGRRLETLAGGTYLGGLAAATDYGTRLLLGRLLALATRNDALLARWAGARPGGLPAPIDLDAAGLRLDAYLKDSTS